MKKIILLLFTIPLLTATTCDNDEECGFSEFNGYNLLIDNPQFSYTINDTIWIHSSVTSKLIDLCIESNDSIIIYDSNIFRESFFSLKLKNASTTNSEISLNQFHYIIDTGSSYDTGYCHNSFYVLPVLSNNQLQYQFRVGIIPKTIGDYAIASGSESSFDNNLDLNAEIFNQYNILNDLLKFKNCGYVYSRRNLYREIYFFKVE